MPFGHFICQEVRYLGHVITPQGLRTNEELVRAVKEFPVPTKLKELRQFLGLSSYYRRFIPTFAEIARPLHALTRKAMEWSWTEDCQVAFDTLKRKLVEAPVLAYPPFEKKFVLETDASMETLNVVLSQRQEDGQLHRIAYASRGLSPAECNYSITD